jgi:hypothetical protein
MSTIIFEAKTHAAHDFKVLVDNLNFYLNNKGTFVINQEGIFLANDNIKKDVMCEVSLLAENFQEFTLNGPEISFSINLNMFYNEMLKKIRKKYTITMQVVDEDRKKYFKIARESADNKGNHSSARIPIVEIKKDVLTPPTGYSLPINVLSKTFQQSCREITRPTSKKIEITCWNNKVLKFFSNKDGVVDNEATFGSCGKELLIETFKCKCPANYIVHPTKLAGLSDTIKIYVTKGLPIYYKMKVGSLGEIGIYIMTEDQAVEDDDENDSIFD